MPRLMKILSVLVLMQTALVITLFAKIDTLEDQMKALTGPASPADASAPTLISPKEAEAVTLQGHGLDDSQLRRILREELQGIAMRDELLDQDSTSAPKAPVYDDVEMQYQQQLVQEELELLKTQGEASTRDLHGLMNKIARLDPERRSEMLMQLNQAMNRGEIKGRL